MTFKNNSLPCIRRADDRLVKTSLLKKNNRFGARWSGIKTSESTVKCNEYNEQLCSLKKAKRINSVRTNQGDTDLILSNTTPLLYKKDTDR